MLFAPDRTATEISHRTEYEDSALEHSTASHIPGKGGNAHWVRRNLSGLVMFFLL